MATFGGPVARAVAAEERLVATAGMDTEVPLLRREEDAKAAVAALVAALGKERVLTHPADLFPYTYDASYNSEAHPGKPDCVVLPRDTADVVTAVQIANRYRVPVVPRGSASAYSGGAVAHFGGIVLAMNMLDKVLEVDADNLQVRVQPGVIHANLNDLLAKSGMIFPPDPGSSKIASVGGMVANNSSGMRAVKYGPTLQYVLGLQVVLPTGEVIWTGGEESKALQSVSGFNLTPLFVMSEGRLGVITELRLKILPKPQARGLVVARFDSLEDAAEMTRRIFRAGIVPSALEIMDRSAIRAVNLYKPDLKLEEVAAMLLVEADGTPAVVADTVAHIEQVARELATSVATATNPKAMEELWAGRAALGAASSLVVPGGARVGMGEDICVPLRDMPATLRGIAQAAERRGVAVVLYGHIGSGNVHSAIVVKHTPEEIHKAQLLTEDIHNLALEFRGTTSGEHGIGVVRRDYADAELGFAVEVMRQMQRAFDPNGIMNPGKKLPFATEKAMARAEPAEAT